MRRLLFSLFIVVTMKLIVQFKSPLINKSTSNSKMVLQALIESNNSIKSKDSKPKPDRFIHPQVMKMFQRAQYLVRNGDNVVAKRLLERCLELNPFDSHSWLALARLEARWGNVARSREIFAESITKCPDNVHILQAWGHMEQKHGDERLARQPLYEALKLDPYNAYVCHTLSCLEIRDNNIAKAREVLLPVVRHRPTAAVCVSLSDLEKQEGNFDKAKEILLTGLQKCWKDRSKLLLSLAWLEEDTFNNLEEACKLIDLAMQQEPQNVRVYMAKANMELRMNKFNKARATLYEALKLESEDGKHYTMLGTLEAESGRYLDAQRVLEQGVRLFPGDFFLLQRLGDFEAKHGSAKKALDAFNKAILIQPHTPTFVAWAALEEALGNAALSPKLSRSKIVELGASPVASSPSPLDTTDVVTPTLNRDTEICSDVETPRGAHQRSPLPRDLPMEFKSPSAAVEYAQSQLNKARELFALGMIVDPRHGPLYHAYGNMESRHGNFTFAREIFLLGIQRNCTDITGLYHAYAVMEIQAQNPDKAIKILKKGIEVGLKKTFDVNPSVKFLFHSLGMLELDNNNPAEAERVFQSGVKIFPTHSHLLLGLALAEIKLGKTSLGRQHFKAAVDADMYHAHAWQCWALFEKNSGNTELASILFKQGLKKNPYHAPLWHAFAMMEVQQGNVDSARSLFAEAIKRSPDHAQTYQAWACLETRLGNLPHAKELSWQGLRRAPNHPALWTVTALVEAGLGDADRARETLMTGIERFPKHGPLYKVLGKLECRRGRFPEARHWFNEGIDKDRHHAPLYHEAAQLEAKLGNLDGLHRLHLLAKAEFQPQQLGPPDGVKTSFASDIIDKISQLELTTVQQNEENRGNTASYIELEILKPNKMSTKQSKNNNVRWVGEELRSYEHSNTDPNGACPPLYLYDVENMHL